MTRSIFYKVEVLEQPEKLAKCDVEFRHYAYDIESMLVSKPQLDGATKDIHKVVLIIARQVYTDANDDNCFQVFHDSGSFFKFALAKEVNSIFPIFKRILIHCLTGPSTNLKKS